MTNSVPKRLTVPAYHRRGLPTGGGLPVPQRDPARAGLPGRVFQSRLSPDRRPRPSRPTMTALFDPQGRLYLTAEEQEAFLAAARRFPREVRTLCLVLHDTSRRESEALALTAGRVDGTGGCLVLCTLKKRRPGAYRAVPVPPATLVSSTWCMASGRRSGPGRGMPTRRCGRLPPHPLAQGPGLDGGRPHCGRSLQMPEGPAARLRRARHRLGRSPQHALQMDGPREHGSDRDLRQRFRGRGAGHRRPHVGVG
jgi:integrase